MCSSPIRLPISRALRLGVRDRLGAREVNEVERQGAWSTSGVLSCKLVDDKGCLFSLRGILEQLSILTHDSKEKYLSLDCCVPFQVRASVPS